MKKIVLFIFIFFPSLLFAQNADSTWFVNNYVKKEVMIPMRDGVKLFTAIYTPKEQSEKHPILLTRTPYSCAPYGQAPYARYWRSFMIEYCKKGYVMVMQDVRGRWMSEGVYDLIRPFNPNKKINTDIDEASDSYDTIDWLVKNVENNNGNVGGTGISFPGFYATMIALSNHPALKAVSPQAPVTDRFMGDDDHHNGVLFTPDAFEFLVGGGMTQPRPKPTTLPAKRYIIQDKDNYSFYLNKGSIANLTKIAGDSLLYWNQMMEHPNYDEFWKSRDARIGIKDIKPAILVVGGLFDAEDNYGAWETYKAFVKQSPGTNSKLVVGPWAHGQWAGPDGSRLGNVQFGSNTNDWYQKSIEIPFFDYYLRGKGSADDISKASVFFTGENKWREFPQWPSEKVKETPAYLEENGKLSFSPVPKKKPTFDSYISDPAKPVPYTEKVHSRRTREYMTDDQRFASRRTDVLVYETDTLSKDIILGGPVIADLLVSLSNTDADFVVKLIDVFPIGSEVDLATNYPMGGYQMLVRGDIMRGKFRNSFSKPEPFVPGKPTQVKFKLPDIAHTFKKGHRMMIQIQSSWFPLADRNPQQFLENIYKAKDSDFVKETINVFHGSSKIILPVID